MELAAVQQEESSSLHRRQAAASCPASGASHGGREPSEVQRAPPARQANAGGAPATVVASAPLLPRPPIHDCVRPNYDARSVIQGRQQARHHANVDHAAARAEDARAYAPNPERSPLRRGGRPCDPDMDRDRSPSPDPTGPNAFSRVIRGASFPQHFRPPVNVVKYTGDTNPGVWLEDYRLACWTGGASDDRFIIQYLPICLGENVSAWLDFLPADSIGS